MFPNIDNNLGINAVIEALEARPVKFLSTDCIVEAVQICLRFVFKFIVRLWVPKTHAGTLI